MRDESLLARYDPAKLNTIAGAIAESHGLVPLDIRYEAAAAALRHIHDEWPPRPSGRPDDGPPVAVIATTFTVTAVPAGVPNRDLFALTVEARGGDTWAVRYLRWCLTAEGEWDTCLDWLVCHRFDLDTALRLARAAAPHVTVDGVTVADAIREERRRRDRPQTVPHTESGGAR